MAIGFHHETVTRLRAPLVDDRYGDKIRDWNNADALTIENCRIIPELVASDRDPSGRVDREVVVDRWLLFAPSGVDILATDHIRWDNDEYVIEGEVLRWPSPSGRLSHIEAHLMQVEG